MLLAIEIVQDRETKSPFEAGLKIHEQIKNTALESGLMVYPSSGCVDGVSGDHVLMAPPFNVKENEIDLIIEKLSQALEITLGPE